MKKIFRISDGSELLHFCGRFIISAICVFIGVSLISFPGDAMKSVENAIKICSETVIPSLYPFLFLSSFIAAYPVSEGGGVLNRLCRKVLGLSSDGVFVFLLSAVGGFPVGAKTAEKMFENGRIGREEAKRLVFASVNPSPAFAVSAVGISLFSNVKTGVVIFTSVVLSNFILLILSRFIFDCDTLNLNAKKEQPDLAAAFTSAGTAASQAMISICGCVIIFTCLCDVMSNYTQNEALLSSLCGIFEVTTGCMRLSAPGNIPLIAGIIGWGGLSVHFQIIGAVEKTGLGLKLFFVSRAACAFLSVIVCKLLITAFPAVTDAISMRSDVIVRNNERGFPVSIMMLLTCFIFLIGDYTVNLKKKPVHTGKR